MWCQIKLDIFGRPGDAAVVVAAVYAGLDVCDGGYSVVVAGDGVYAGDGVDAIDGVNAGDSVSEATCGDIEWGS